MKNFTYLEKLENYIKDNNIVLPSLNSVKDNEINELNEKSQESLDLTLSTQLPFDDSKVVKAPTNFVCDKCGGTKLVKRELSNGAIVMVCANRPWPDEEPILTEAERKEINALPF